MNQVKTITIGFICMLCLPALTSGPATAQIKIKPKITKYSKKYIKMRRKREAERRAQAKRRREAERKAKARRKERLEKARKEKAQREAKNQAELKEIADRIRKREKQEGKAAKHRKKVLDGKYEALIREAQLTPVQQAKLMELLRSMKAAVAKKQEANKKDLVRLSKARKEAKQSGDSDSLREINHQIRELELQVQDIRNDYDRQITGLLTDAQKTKWAGYGVYTDLCRRLRDAGLKTAPSLTGDQKKTIRTLCDELAAGLGAGATSETKASRKARGLAVKTLMGQVVEQVLTDKQRRAMEAAKALQAAKAQARKDARRARKDDADRMDEVPADGE